MGRRVSRVFRARSADEVRKDAASFVDIGGMVFARGRDPDFPAWPDVLPLNASLTQGPQLGFTVHL